MRSIGLDVETTGIDIYHGCSVFSIAICDGEAEQSWYFEFPVDPYTRQVEYDADTLQRVQELIDSYDEVIIHNAAFDYPALRKIGIKIPWERVRDTQIASHVLYSIGPHGLKMLKIKHLNLPSMEEEDLGRVVQRLRTKGEKLGYNLASKTNPQTPTSTEKVWKADMHLIPLMGTDEDKKCLRDYNLDDAAVSWALFQIMWEEIVRRGHEDQFWWRMDSVKTAITMKHNGVTIHKPSMERKRAEFLERQQQHYDVCHSIAPINLNSSEQLVHQLFEVWDLPKTRMTDGGTYTTEYEEIERIKDDLPNGNIRTYLENLLEYKQYDTGIAYIENYRRYGRETKHPDYLVINPSYNVTGTSWTRLSSSGPNQQNVGKDSRFGLRSIYGPLPDEVWYSFDQDNVELRIFAWDSGDENLINAYLHGGSVHLIFAEVVYPEQWASVGGDGKRFKEEFGDTYYQWVKNGNFSLIYGAGEDKADRTYGRKGAYRTIRTRMPKIDAYLSRWQDMAEQLGYIETMGGYRLYVSQDAPHKASNGRIQGTASQILQIVSNKMRDWLDAEHRCCKVLMNIHDEINIKAPRDYPFPLEEANKLLMDTIVDFPITVSSSIIRTFWSEKEAI